LQDLFRDLFGDIDDGLVVPVLPGLFEPGPDCFQPELLHLPAFELLVFLKLFKQGLLPELLQVSSLIRSYTLNFNCFVCLYKIQVVNNLRAERAIYVKKIHDRNQS